MRCLYCGKELALFKRLRGGEFCSDAHRQRYQEEYTQLALNRLLQANAPKDTETKDPENDPLTAESRDPKALEQKAWEQKTRDQKTDQRPQLGTPDQRPPVPESPALKRRERVLREDPAAALSPAAGISSPAPVSSSASALPSSPAQSMLPPAATLPAAAALRTANDGPVNPAAPQTAVLDPEPEPQPNPVFAPLSAPEPVAPPEVQAPAGMSSFLVEFPTAAEAPLPWPVFNANQLAAETTLSLPRLQEFKPDPDAAYLDPAERITLSSSALTDFPSPPRERGLELREFVRGVPQVEIHVKPAVESGFELVNDAFEVDLDPQPPEGSPGLWLALEQGLPAVPETTEVLLGDLARLDFALTGWGTPDSASAEGASSENASLENASLESLAPETQAEESQAEPAAEPAPLPADRPILAARIEPAKVEPVRQETAWAAARPEPVHFEPVHIDPVFMEKIAGAESTPAAPAKEDPALTTPAVMAAEAEEAPVVTAPQVMATQDPAVSEPAAPPSPQEPAPASGVTRPLPVTLHGLAPLRGKPMQAFTAAMARNGGIQIPIDLALPLRPVMVLGPASKSANPEPETERAAPPARPIPIPEKSDRADTKPRRSEVRVLPVQVKEQAKPEAVKQSPYRIEPPRGEGTKQEATKNEAGKPEQVKSEPKKAEAVKETPAAGRPKGSQASAKPADSKPAEPKSANMKPGPAARPDPKQPEPAPKTPAETRPARTPAPAEEPLDLLGLPKLSFQQKETFWSKLPGTARIGVIAAVLALVIGGVVLTSRGSGSAKPAVTAPPEPVLVEEPALGNTAGWIQDWFADRAGAKQGRHVDVLRGSLTARDYRLLFEGQIERGALGWVFRADEKSFYVEKIQVLTPGREPVVALVRFAVINGVEQNRVQVPLSLQAHLDTLYKVRMDIVGDKFTTWLQDEKVDQWTDNQLSVGGVGLYYDSGDSAKLRDTLNVIPLKRK